MNRKYLIGDLRNEKSIRNFPRYISPLTPFCKLFGVKKPRATDIQRKFKSHSCRRHVKGFLALAENLLAATVDSNFFKETSDLISRGENVSTGTEKINIARSRGCCSKDSTEKFIAFLLSFVSRRGNKLCRVCSRCL